MFDLENFLSKIKPSNMQSQTKASQLEPWFSQSDLHIDMDSDSRTLNEWAEKVLEASERPKDMLSEECGHLLRQAQIALSKAQKIDDPKTKK